MTTVSPRLCCRRPISRSNSAAPIGSRPAGEPGALAHATRQLGGIPAAGVERQADQRDLEAGQLVEQALGQGKPLAQRHLDVLRHGQRAEQGPVLEQHALIGLQRAPRAIAQLREVVAQHLDPAALRAQQAEQLAQQHRLAGTRAAHDAEHLAALHLEVEPVMHHQPIEAGAKPLDPYHRHRRPAHRHSPR
jgi:hypothetical protein